MAILNYTTSVDSQKTILEIQKLLSKRGATKMIMDYEEGHPTALTFALPINGQLIAFPMPANYSGVLRALQKDKSVPAKYRNREQALRVCWRIVLTWAQAQMAIVDIQLAEMAEVFLPYAVTKSGNTLFKEISNGDGIKLLQ